jgi:protein involved in polysaccharide export with SLBB domain
MKFNILALIIVSFFLLGSVSAQVPSAAAAPTRGYTLGPGDEVTAKVLGEAQYDFVATVTDDGKIEVPFFDEPIMAKCKTERELKAEVTKLLSKYLRDPQLSFRVTAEKSRPPATVYGEVKSPNKYELP